MSTRPRSSVLAAALCLLPLASAARARNLDEGLLQPEWFGGALDWHQAEEIDYIWVDDGFALEGKTLQIADWEQPQFLHQKDRDTKDSARAYELTENMPGWLRGALGSALSGTAEVSRESGDLRLEGRFVDVNAGNKVAKWLVGFGAGSATATWDMKIVDAQSGKLLVAIHHRTISGTNMSEIGDKIIKWLDEALVPAVRSGLSRTYAGGKPVKE